MSNDMQAAPIPSNASNIPSVPQNTKASVNPINHFIKGVKALFSTNSATILIIGVVSLVVNIAFMAILIYFIFKDGTSLLNLEGYTINGSFIAKMLVTYLVFAVIQTYVGLALFRTILTGVRRQKISTAQAFTVAKDRLGIMILFVLAIFGIVVLTSAIISASMVAFPPLGVILYIAAIIFSIIFALRLIYVQFVSVDEHKPTSVKDIYEKSSAVWKRSQSATIVYFISLVVASGVFFAILSGILPKAGAQTPRPNSYTTDNSYNDEETKRQINEVFNQYQSQRKVMIKSAEPKNLAAVLVGYSVTTLFGTILACAASAGLANIYDEVAGSKDAPLVATGPTPVV